MTLDKMEYNHTQWELTSDNKLINKNDGNCYPILGEIIGIKQIGDETFLIHRRAMPNTWNIARLKLVSGKLIPEFSKNCTKFTFLTEDTILFDNELVYSISKNGEVPESKWIKMNNIEVHTDENGKPLVLFVEECVSPLGDYVQVLVDINTFKPIHPAYSTLRDTKVPLTESFTFKDLVKEDLCYIRTIQNYFFGLNSKLRIKGRKALLEEYNIKNK